MSHDAPPGARRRPRCHARRARAISPPASSSSPRRAPRAPLGFTCQSFASLSLDPPLVSLAPARTSSTWPRIRAVGAFCVNVLAADHRGRQRGVRPLRSVDKFAGVALVARAVGRPGARRASARGSTARCGPSTTAATTRSPSGACSTSRRPGPPAAALLPRTLRRRGFGELFHQALSSALPWCHDRAADRRSRPRRRPGLRVRRGQGGQPRGADRRRASRCPTASASAPRPTRRPPPPPGSPRCSTPPTSRSGPATPCSPRPIPDDVAAAITAAYLALGEACRSRCGRRPPPRTSRRASFAGQQDTYLNVVGVDAVLDAVRRCWASLWTDRAVAYRADAGIDARGRPARRGGAADGRRAGRGRAVHRRPGQRPAHPQRARRRAPAWATPSCPARSTPTTASWTTGRDADRDPAAARPAGGGVPRPTAQVRDAGVELGRRVEAHFGARRTSSGRSTATARCGSPSRGRSPRSTRVPPPRDGRACACTSTPQLGPGPHPPDHADGAVGVPGRRRIARRRSPPARPSTRCKGPAGFGIAGDRAFVDITAVLRNPVGPRVVPAHLRCMEARSAVVVRELLATSPRWRPPFGSRRPWRSPGRVLRILLRYRVPALVALALARPAAARRRSPRAATSCGAPAPSRSPATGTPGSRTSSTMLAARSRRRAAHRARVRRRVPRARAGRAGSPGRSRRAAVHEVLRGLPHNVTTEMDLRAVGARQRMRADQASAAAPARGADRGELAARFHAGTLPPSLQRRARRVPAPLRPPGRRRDRPRHAALVRRPDARARRRWPTTCGSTTPTGRPDARFAARRRAAEAGRSREVVARVRRRSRARACVVGFALRPRAAARRAARDAQGPPRPADRPRPRRARAPSAPSWPAAACSPPPTTSSSSTCARSRAALDGADQRARRRRPPRASTTRELRRRHVPRVLLSDGTEPEAERAAPAPRTGALVGTPGLGGHRHGRRAGGPRPGRRPPGAGRDPRRSVHRPRLDPAVPHRGRAGDGDGRGELARRRRRAGVRHPGGRRRAGRHDAAHTGQTVTVDGAAGTVVSA